MSDTTKSTDLKKFFHVQPVPDKAERIHRLLRENIKENYIKLAQNVETSLNGNGYRVDLDSVIDRLESLDVSRRFSPGLYVHHSELVGAMNAGNPGQTVHELGKLMKFDESDIYRSRSGLAVKSALTEPWEDYAIPVAKGSTPKTSFVFPISDEQRDEFASEVQEALSFIENADEGLRAEIDEYATTLRLFNGHNIIGATSPKFYGNIYLQRPDESYTYEERIAFFIEHIVHEGSHLHASALEIHDELVLNSPDERFTAPIRPDARPMSGIFHATFVLSRITRVFRRLSEKTDINVFEDYYERAETEYRHGYDNVVEHGDLTPMGEQIAEEFEAVARN
jgi:hypothetical protein